MYDKRTDGQIFTVPISPSTGYTGLVENLGLVSNKGVEVSADGKPSREQGFYMVDYVHFFQELE